MLCGNSTALDNTSLGHALPFLAVFALAFRVSNKWRSSGGGCGTCEQDVLGEERYGSDAANGKVWEVELDHCKQETHLCRNGRPLESHLQTELIWSE